MNTAKILMSEAAALYYKKNLTQYKIAETIHLSRQTVTKLFKRCHRRKSRSSWIRRTMSAVRRKCTVW